MGIQNHLNIKPELLDDKNFFINDYSQGQIDKESSSSLTNVFIIGISGGSASGKSSVSDQITKNLNVPWVVLISMDSFYKILSPEQSARALNNEYNFDHPDAFDFPLLIDILQKLKKGMRVEIPNYDFTTHSRKTEYQLVEGATVVIFEGIFALYDSLVMNLMDMKIFVHTDADVRLSRRLVRDIYERGRDVKGVLEQYNRFVKPSFDDFIQPTVRNADIIIPRGLCNTVAIDLITEHISRKLQERNIGSAISLNEGLDSEHPNITRLKETSELKSLNKEFKKMHSENGMSRNCFAFKRLSILLIERSVSKFYSYCSFNSNVYAISLGYSCNSAEEHLKTVISNLAILRYADISIGDFNLKMNCLNSESSLGCVFILDLDLRSPNHTVTVINEVLKRKVPLEVIILVTFVSFPREILQAFPKLKVVTSQSITQATGNHQ